MVSISHINEYVKKTIEHDLYGVVIEKEEQFLRFLYPILYIQSKDRNDQKCDKTQKWDRNKSQIVHLEGVAGICERTGKTGRDVYFLEEIMIGFEKDPQCAQRENIPDIFGAFFS